MTLINLNELESINFDIDEYSDLYSLYKDDLGSYIQTFSGERKDNYGLASRHLLNKLTAKWQPVFGFAFDRISDDIREIQTPKINRVTSLSLREALNYYNPGGNWLIPNIIRSVGLYMLGGEPKSGKSWLVYHIMYSLAVSQQFMGRPVKTGRILFLQLEEPLETISERLFLSGFGDMASEETSLIVNFMDIIRIERQFDITSDINWLMKIIDEYKPILVIIDSLRMASMKSKSSENSDDKGKEVYALQQVFNFTGTCGILIHHMNKLNGRNSKKATLIDRMSGHTSLTSATDGLIGITSEETSEGRLMTLRTLPRNGVAILIQYKMVTTEGGLCELEKIYEDTPATLPVTGKIIRYLANSPDSYYPAKSISKAIDLEVSDDDNFRKSLSYLQSSQIISSRYFKHSFQYCLTSDSLWLVNPTNITENLQVPAILDANAIMRCHTKRDLRELILLWDLDRRRQAMTYLFTSERERIQGLIESWEFDINDEVIYHNELHIVVERLHKPGLSKTTYLLHPREPLSNDEDDDDVEALELDLVLASSVEPFTEEEMDEYNTTISLDIVEILSDEEDNEDIFNLD